MRRLLAIALAVGVAACHRCEQAKVEADKAWRELIQLERRRGHEDHAQLAEKARARALAGEGDWANELQRAAMWEIATPGDNPFLDKLSHAINMGMHVKERCTD